MASQWFCIQILGNLRGTAEFHLKRQSFEPFFPRIIVRRSKTESYIEALFQNYGFVKFDVEVDQWRSVNGTRGVVSLLPKWTLLPEPMSAGFVEYFIENDPIELNEFSEVFEKYYPGSLVEVTEGLLQGKKGVVLEVRSKLLEIVVQSGKSSYTVLVPKDKVKGD
jgi:transcription antitermination factor NusG